MIDIFNPDTRNKITSELDKRGVNKPCPRCGNEKFSLIDGYVNQKMDPDTYGNLLLGASVVPCIMTACTRCGFLCMHALGALGLLEGGKENDNS